MSVDEFELHDWYVAELVSLFEKKGYKAIIEGGIPKYKNKNKEWYKPDIFVLKGLKLNKIVEVTLSDSKEGSEPNSVLNKCRKIREYYNPPEIIVFEPTGYTSNKYPATLKGHASYDEINAELRDKWKREGLNVTFWNDWNLEEQKKKRNKP